MVQTRIESPGTLRSRSGHLISLALGNPVMVKELRSRMRGPRAYWILLGYLGLLCGILFLCYLEWWQSNASFGSPSPLNGRQLFEAVFYTQAALMSLIVPAITSGTITLENEQRTYELLATAVLSAEQVVMGKLMPAVLFAGLLLTSSLPLASIAFLLGGVSPGELVSACAIMVAGSILFAALGVGWSAVARRTAAATSAAIASVVLCTVMALPAFTMDGWFVQALNPITAVSKSLATWSFYKLTAPCWIPSLVINLLAARLLMTLAAGNLPLFNSRLTLTLRVQWALLFLVTGLCVTANVWGSGSMVIASGQLTAAEAEEVVGILALFGYAVSLAVLPAFCTERRDGYSAEAPVESGWRSRLSSLGTAPVFLASLLIIYYMTAWTGLPSMGKSAGLIPFSWWLKISIATLIPLLSFGTLSVLLSKVMSGRGAAAGTILAIIVAFTLLPMLTLINYDPMLMPDRPVIQNVLYLSSALSVMEVVSSQGEFKQTFPQFDSDPLPFWQVTTMIYLLIGLVSVVFIRVKNR